MRFRSYLPGRMLPMLLGKFRDDVAESLGKELLPLPHRSGPVKVVKLDDLTSSELDMLSDSVRALLTRFTALMDDPLLPNLLREFRARWPSISTCNPQATKRSRRKPARGSERNERDGGRAA